MSAPFSASGMPLAWIAVSFANCDSLSPDCVGLESGRSVKVAGGGESFASSSATRVHSAPKSSSSRFLFKLFGRLNGSLSPFCALRAQDGAMSVQGLLRDHKIKIYQGIA